MNDTSASPPRHIAIIMDGNGRWARQQGGPRAQGHQAGFRTTRDIVEVCGRLQIESLTLFAFSSENWKRPADEVDHLMGLLRKFILSDLEEFVANDVKLKIIGDYKALAPDIVDLIEDALEQTAKGKRTLAVALNYGAQQEIVRAATLAAEQGEISESALESHLFTADLPPLDLLIRTSGEVRLSNFLLWQAAYAEMMFTEVLWPDYTPEHLEAALTDFETRDRRYGGR